MDSNSCSTLYTSGKSSYESYAEWNKKFDELLQIEHGLNLSREEYMQSAATPHYHDAEKLIRNREISPISLYKQVTENRLKLIDERESFENTISCFGGMAIKSIIIDLNRAIATYDNHLHDKGVPFTMNTALEIAIPSGKIVMTDNFMENFVPDGSFEGESAWMHNLAVGYMRDYKIATARIDETPTLLRKNSNDFIMATLGEEDEEILEGEEPVEYNRTGLYDYSIELMDYDNWLDKVGTRLEDSRDYSLLDVKPGVYLWTVYSHNQEFYEHYYNDIDTSNDRNVYAELTFVRGL